MTRLTRSRRLSSAYSLMDELMASATEPMPEAMQSFQMTRIYAGLHAIETAPAPSVDDWRVVSDAINMTETLVSEMRICEDGSGLLDDAVTAMGKAGMRHLAGANIRLDARGIQAVRAIVEDYMQLLAALPHRTMIRCHRLTEKRIMEIYSGHKKSSDVSIVSV